MFILHGSSTGRPPPISFPIFNPRCYTILDIVTIRKKLYVKNATCETFFECIDDGRHFHDIVRCIFRTSTYVIVPTERHGPSPGPWIAETTSIRVHTSMHLVCTRVLLLTSCITYRKCYRSVPSLA